MIKALCRPCRWLFTTLAFTCISIIISYAQPMQLASDSSLVLKGSNKAIQFGLGDFSSAALQYWLSDNQAVIGGIILQSGTHVNSVVFGTFDPFENVRVGAFAVYRYYFQGKKQFSPFAGLGSNISWRQSRFPNQLSTETGYNLGLSAGMECFLLPWLSITGQGGVGLNYASIKTEQPRSMGAEPSFAYSFNVSLGNYGVTLAIYF